MEWCLKICISLPLEVYISAYCILCLHRVETFPESHNSTRSQSLSAVQTIFEIDRKEGYVTLENEKHSSIRRGIDWLGRT